MATRVMLDCYVSWHSQDLSDHVRSATLTYTAEMLDDTAMGDVTRSRVGGLKDVTVDIEFYADEASNKVQQLFFADMGTAYTLIIRPDKSEGVSAANPNYTLTASPDSIPLVAGAVGEMQMAPVHLLITGGAALSRAVE